jgi:hypothetical protein
MLDGYTAKYGIILEVFIDETVVGGPTHPRRFQRNPPVIQIGWAEFRLQFGPADMGSVDLSAELTMVGSPSAPILAATKKHFPGRSPENWGGAIYLRTQKIPLPAAKMARHQNELNTLLEVLHINLQPSKFWTAHVRGDDARGKYLSGHLVIPLDTSRAYVRAESY